MACATFLPTHTTLSVESPGITIHGYTDRPHEADSLHPDVAYDPIAAKTSHERWAILYKTACVVTVVAFTALFALAVWSSGATATFETATVFVLLLLLFLPAVGAYALDWWKEGRTESKKAAMAQKLIEKMEPLTEEVIAERLKTWGITSKVAPAQLASVLAQYDLLIESSKKHQKQASSPFSPANVQHNLAEDDFRALVGDREVDASEDLEPLFKNRTIAATNFRDRTESRIHDVGCSIAKSAAYEKMLAAWDKFRAIRLLKLIEDPYLNDAALAQFYSAVPLTIDARAFVATRFEDGSTNILVKTQTTPPTFYSPEGLLERDPVVLAREIFNLEKV